MMMMTDEQIVGWKEKEREREMCIIECSSSELVL